jgi:uncharacterized membrane protein YadS
VIAAAAPLGATAVQMGTLVKLVRVLMLGPVCVVLTLIGAKIGMGPRDGSGAVSTARPSITKLVPWFIIGFLCCLGLRASGVVPAALIAPAGHVSTALTIVSMAALGLGCDIRTVAKAGGRVTASVILSLVMLGTVSWGLIRLLGFA